jgi:hypothetical protein
MARQLHDTHLFLTINSRDCEGLTFKEFAINWVEAKAAAELLHRFVCAVSLVNPRPPR